MLNLTAQNLVEFWPAITRPVDENGLGFTTEQAAAEVDTRLVAAYRQFRQQNEKPHERDATTRIAGVLSETQAYCSFSRKSFVVGGCTN